MGKVAIAVLGIDLGKNSCSLAGLDASGAIVVRRRLTREGVIKFVAGRSTGLGRKRGRQANEQPGFEDPTLVPDFAQEPKDEPHVTRVKEGRRGKAKRVT